MNVRSWTGPVLLAIVDAALLLGISAIILAVRSVFPGAEGLQVGAHRELGSLVIIFVSIFGVLGLYRPTALGAAEELKSLVKGLTLGFLVVAALSFLAKSADTYSRAVFLLAWISNVVAFPSSVPEATRSTARWVHWKTPGMERTSGGHRRRPRRARNSTGGGR